MLVPLVEEGFGHLHVQESESFLPLPILQIEMITLLIVCVRLTTDKSVSIQSLTDMCRTHVASLADGHGGDDELDVGAGFSGGAVLKEKVGLGGGDVVLTLGEFVKKLLLFNDAIMSYILISPSNETLFLARRSSIRGWYIGPTPIAS